MTEDWKKACAVQAQCAYPEATIVFGEGPFIRPLLAVIGEAPGAEEEKLRRPFVGKAGKNLDSFLAVLGLMRAEVYITNLVKLRPSKISKAGRVVNRAPNKEEISLFAPMLRDELAIAAPRFIATLGNFALRAMLGDDTATIGQHHGKLIQLPDGRELFPLYHPASVIYNRALADVYAADLAALRETLRRVEDARSAN